MCFSEEFAHIIDEISTSKTIKCCWKKLKKPWINGGTFHVHGLKDSILQSCHFSPVWSIDSLQPQSKCQWFVYGIWQADSKIYIEMKRAKNSQGTPKRKMNKMGKFTLPDRKTYHKALVKYST